jgi:hypothetical protein
VPDDVAKFGSTGRLQAEHYTSRLEQGGFSGRIRSDDQVEAGLELRLEIFEASELSELEPGEHGCGMGRRFKVHVFCVAVAL